jgi:hypothetical protein
MRLGRRRRWHRPLQTRRAGVSLAARQSAELAARPARLNAAADPSPSDRRRWRQRSNGARRPFLVRPGRFGPAE